MNFSILYWNILLDNQAEGSARLNKLLAEIKLVVDKYQPDFIGLNEVVRYYSDKTPVVLDLLESLGYKYNHYLASTPYTENYEIGDSLSSKYEFSELGEVDLGLDVPAHERGYSNFNLKTIVATVALGSSKLINIFVCHPTFPKRSTLMPHYRQIKTLSAFLNTPKYMENTILGGDFNEPAHLLNIFKNMNKNNFHQRTGTFINRTWRLNNSAQTVIRSNLDKIFWSKKGSLKFHSFEVVKSNISDHKPILAKFEYLD